MYLRPFFVTPETQARASALRAFAIEHRMVTADVIRGIVGEIELTDESFMTVPEGWFIGLTLDQIPNAGWCYHVSVTLIDGGPKAMPNDQVVELAILPLLGINAKLTDAVNCEPVESLHSVDLWFKYEGEL